MKFKKIIITSALLLLGAISNFATAVSDTNFDFGFTSNINANNPTSAILFSSILTGIGGNFTGINNVRYGTDVINNITVSGSYTAPNTMTGLTLTFNDVTQGNVILTTTFLTYFPDATNLLVKTINPTLGGGTDTAASFSVSGGAPEIDGSLAPKVGFLLGCLFLMFGRKKQNTEPFMTA